MLGLKFKCNNWVLTCWNSPAFFDWCIWVWNQLFNLQKCWDLMTRCQSRMIGVNLRSLPPSCSPASVADLWKRWNNDCRAFININYRNPRSHGPLPLRSPRRPSSSDCLLPLRGCGQLCQMLNGKMTSRSTRTQSCHLKSLFSQLTLFMHKNTRGNLSI